jgi:hypothetical protein
VQAEGRSGVISLRTKLGCHGGDDAEGECAGIILTIASDCPDYLDLCIIKIFLTFIKKIKYEFPALKYNEYVLKILIIIMK